MTKSPHPSSVDKGELLPVTVEEYDPDFVEAWTAQEDAGYIYSESNIAKVYLGWQLARQARPNPGIGMLEAINDTLAFYDALGLPHAPGEAEILDRLDQARRQAHSLPGDVGMREALEGFACLEVPTKRRGNAGFYSIPFDRIEKAQAALAGGGSAAPAAEMRRIVSTLANADCECDAAFSVKICLSCQARAALTPSALSGDAGEAEA